jgi:RNA polymerase sigma factor (sigma-70 family)
MGQPLDIPLEQLLRELTPQVLGVVVRRFRDFAAAEDAVQEALVAAATQWPDHGLPENPRAWLTQVAFRRMTDQIRSESARRRREGQMVLEASRVPNTTTIDSASQEEEEDTLVLLFMSCLANFCHRFSSLGRNKFKPRKMRGGPATEPI